MVKAEEERRRDMEVAKAMHAMRRLVVFSFVAWSPKHRPACPPSSALAVVEEEFTYAHPLINRNASSTDEEPRRSGVRHGRCATWAATRLVCASVPSFDFFSPATSCATLGRLIEIISFADDDLHTITLDTQPAFLHVPEVDCMLRDLCRNGRRPRAWPLR